MELEKPGLLRFDELGFQLEIVLKSDRIVLRLLSTTEQLELPFDLTLPQDEDRET
jgi:hypothetical protein